MTRTCLHRPGRRPSRIAALGLGALGALAWPAGAQAKDSVTISIVQAMSGNEWSTEVAAGANAAAREFGGKVKLRIAGPSAIDPPKQAQMFLNELDTGPDALVVVNIAPPLFTQPATDAQSRGAKVVWINVPPTTDVPDALLVSADAYEMGRAGGSILVDSLAQKLGKPAADLQGDVVTGICEIGLTVVENRLTGVAEAFHALAPKVDVLPKFKSNSDRARSFAIWDQAIRAKPNALTYVDPCEQGEENIPKILQNDGMKVPFVSFDTPEEVRDDIAQGTVTAAIPSNFFMQAYLAVHVAADSLLNGRPMPKGWLKVPTVTIDGGNVAAYSKAWTDPETGLRAFYAPQIDAALKMPMTDLPPAQSYNTPGR